MRCCCRTAGQARQSPPTFSNLLAFLSDARTRASSDKCFRPDTTSRLAGFGAAACTQASAEGTACQMLGASHAQLLGEACPIRVVPGSSICSYLPLSREVVRCQVTPLPKGASRSSCCNQAGPGRGLGGPGLHLTSYGQLESKAGRTSVLGSRVAVLAIRREPRLVTGGRPMARGICRLAVCMLATVAIGADSVGEGNHPRALCCTETERRRESASSVVINEQ